MKKVFAMILALAMVLSLAVGASAASITIKDNVVGGTTSGETYNAYLVFNATFEGDNPTGAVSYTIDSTSKFFSTVQGLTTYFKLTQVNSTTTYNVEFIGTNDEAAAKAIASALNAVTDKVVTATATFAEGKATFTELAKGYYLITDSLGSALVIDTLGTAEINTKNSYPSMDKKIVEGEQEVATTTADQGEVVTYKIKVSIPATAVGAITVHDAIPTSMTYDACDDNAVTVADATHGTVACKEFTIPAAVVAENLGEDYTFTYTAKVNADAATATAMTNTAYLTYSKFTSTTVSAAVYTYEIDAFKYTGTDTALAGAGFKLKNSEGKFYKENEDGTVTWVATEAEGTEKTSGTDGKFAFVGVANGNYTLIETTVPAGYNKSNDITVDVNNANVSAETLKIVNNTGSELPSTGGMGTTLFYIIGAALMMGAAVLMITKKRVSNI